MAQTGPWRLRMGPFHLTLLKGGLDSTRPPVEAQAPSTATVDGAFSAPLCRRVTDAQLAGLSRNLQREMGGAGPASALLLAGGALAAEALMAHWGAEEAEAVFPRMAQPDGSFAAVSVLMFREPPKARLSGAA